MNFLAGSKRLWVHKLFLRLYLTLNHSPADFDKWLLYKSEKQIAEQNAHGDVGKKAENSDLYP
ncbi:MAG TPA: hypothetical protein VN038_12060 [Dyadobacter sp.]|nr:hypothetical protein [Dyadobacter sp.]